MKYNAQTIIQDFMLHEFFIYFSNVTENEFVHLLSTKVDGEREGFGGAFKSRLHLLANNGTLMRL